RGKSRDESDPCFCCCYCAYCPDELPATAQGLYPVRCYDRVLRCVLHPDRRITTVLSCELHLGTLDADPYGCLLGYDTVPVPLHSTVFERRYRSRACQERAIHAGKLYHHRSMGNCVHPRPSCERHPADPT